MILRDKFNKKINNIFKDYYLLSEIKEGYLDYKNLNIKVINEGFYSIKYLFDYEIEKEELLKKVLDYINSFNYDGLKELCDKYEYRFVSLYDFLLGNIDINDHNRKKLIDLFLYILVNTCTLNGLNLSIFMIYILGSNEIRSICNALIRDDIDYLEVLSFIYNGDYDGNDIYFKIVSNRYKGKFLIYDNIKNINDITYYSCIFYLQNIKDFNINKENIKDYISFLKDFKLLIERRSSFLLDLPRIRILKDIYKSTLILDNYTFNDLNIIYKYSSLINKYNKHQFIVKYENYIIENLIFYINRMNYKKVYLIVRILNNIDLDISPNLRHIISVNYDNVTFQNLILSYMVRYKYLYRIIDIIEETSYLNHLIKDRNFLLRLLRCLVIIYSKGVRDNLVGIKFLKCIMEYEDLYILHRSYINHIIICIMRIGA